MTEHVDQKVTERQGLRKVWNVSEFARRYRLDSREENRLLKLLGPFASEQELLMNATRTPIFR
ncbi:hypothetical protein SAMN05880590_101117 [Rhizobium sp. RU35A]|uniref:Uncharacterized protein n=1 Tax=Rhizobium straminoryzae TaxID=1387186 RepID=A0A549T9H8_9HYPH|nr:MULTISPECIES: hypothetical protein [Rhizobium]TRL38520.1 hypothetical protein FNA46_12315 [Rhizobium straminoryzae]SIP90490.1 hypothetical protein SAMN05880590_101117 [Rhizobium sp. RU35A]